MVTIESLLKQVNAQDDFKHDAKELLNFLEQTTKSTEERFKLELLQQIDNDTGEKLPSGKLVDITSVSGVFPVSAAYKKVEQSVSSLMQPHIEDAAKIVQLIIPKLLSRSLLLFLNHNKKNTSTITRRYLYTDQIEIYKLDLKICYYKVQCNCLSDMVDTIYCIAGSKSTVDIDRIDFPSLADFYQRQLLAHGIDRNELFHLYNEMKDAYYRQRYPHMPFVLR